MRDPARMRERYRGVAWKYRNYPGQFGLRPHTVEVGLGVWSVGDTGLGTVTTTWTAIVERGGLPPKVRWVSQEEIAVGNLLKGSVEIGPITPDFSGGGTSVATIMLDSIQLGQTRHVRITGPEHPNGALYEIDQAHFEKALHCTLVCHPVANQTIVIADTNFLTDSSGNILTDGSNQLNNA